MEESIAITAYNRERNATYLAPLFAIAGPDDKQKLMDNYRGIIFPEEGYQSHLYIKKAQRTFQRMRDIEIKISPTATKPKEGWVKKEPKVDGV